MTHSPAQDSFVQVVGAVCGGQHHHIVGLVRQHAIPQLHELRLERGCGLMLVRAPAAQQGVDLICMASIGA